MEGLRASATRPPVHTDPFRPKSGPAGNGRRRTLHRTPREAAPLQFCQVPRCSAVGGQPWARDPQVQDSRRAEEKGPGPLPFGGTAMTSGHRGCAGNRAPTARGSRGDLGRKARPHSHTRACTPPVHLTLSDVLLHARPVHVLTCADDAHTPTHTRSHTCSSHTLAPKPTHTHAHMLTDTHSHSPMLTTHSHTHSHTTHTAPNGVGHGVWPLTPPAQHPAPSSMAGSPATVAPPEHMPQGTLVKASFGGHLGPQSPAHPRHPVDVPREGQGEGLA